MNTAGEHRASILFFFRDIYVFKNSIEKERMPHYLSCTAT
jgi:hypothetical protein